MTEETIEVVKHVPQEHVPNHPVQQLVDMPGPQIQKETDEVTQFMPQERTAGRIVDVPGRQNQEHIVGVVPDIFIERMTQRRGEQNVGVVKVTALERVQSRTGGKFIDVRLEWRPRTPVCSNVRG